MDVFQFPTLEVFLTEIREAFTLKELAAKIGLSFQSVSLVFAGKPHWVLKHVASWRRALKLQRLEGDYFELLAIIAAYPFESKRVELLKRAFHLVGRLESHLNPSGDAASSLVYWLDPLCPLLRNAVEVAGFPADEKDITAWISERVETFNVLAPSAAVFSARVMISWKWLKKLGAVNFSDHRQVWEKKQPTLISAGKFSAQLKDIQSALFSMTFVNIFHEFLSTIDSDSIIVTKFGTFSLPSRHFELLRQLCTDFVVETAQKLNYACNQDDLERLRASDAAYYEKVIRYIEELKEKGYDVSPVHEGDVDTVVQIVLAARRLLR
ncbi:MAG: hypothetical protein C4523_01145 [Myxococcales bacterium]|nr:MAG: hypothetical protein C4523_01145 [Myxococcales bacterium]